MHVRLTPEVGSETKIIMYSKRMNKIIQKDIIKSCKAQKYAKVMTSFFMISLLEGGMIQKRNGVTSNLSRELKET